MFVIGRQGENELDFFPGDIDEVAVYDEALPPARIAAHYTAVRH